MKRLLSCYASDFKDMKADELKNAILASEGRTILGETVVTAAPLLEGVTNAEVMSAFGADLILLNEFDVFLKKINGMKDEENPISKIKNLVGRPVGINLEPVDESANLIDEKVKLSSGRLATIDTFKEAEKLGVDFICLTGNPSTGVSNEAINNSIANAKKYYSGLILAGKMHGAGMVENLVDEKMILSFVDNGADGILLPAVGTVPGINENLLSDIVRKIKSKGALVMSAIGTSQESADVDTIRLIGMSNKRIGADIHHIGDGGYGRMADPENIMALSITVRGKRHTYFKMAQSINR
ncbi:haloacid dehalogenase-like hydrolase [Clostridium sartagoforme]|uniref:Haloacid dehalogenase-like hydrolase n=1 Tax=Clostridium sartagoforme TaxID=84031 RepID=A0A4S2DI35_9CLOT|nr:MULTISPECIES: haloacid dehalogenase-like hydrolase [Clostridium]MBS5938621.1 haloacid dehalogenase-like hydrolase [Clostridium sp.]TGY41807.1 haloacid dehalogenase-like hydrolase [Clostridium sartagoforme]